MCACFCAHICCGGGVYGLVMRKGTCVICRLLFFVMWRGITVTCGCRCGTEFKLACFLSPLPRQQVQRVVEMRFVGVGEATGVLDERSAVQVHLHNAIALSM